MTAGRDEARPDPVSELVIDGANRIGSANLGLGGALTFVITSLFVAAMLSRRQSRTAKIVGLALSIICLFFSFPGLWTLAAGRADAPMIVGNTASKIGRLSSQLEAFATRRQCATVESTCTACTPIVRFALAKMKACEAPARIVLFDDALETGCIEQAGVGTRPVLSCGTRGAL